MFVAPGGGVFFCGVAAFALQGDERLLTAAILTMKSADFAFKLGDALRRLEHLCFKVQTSLTRSAHGLAADQQCRKSDEKPK